MIVTRCSALHKYVILEDGSSYEQHWYVDTPPSEGTIVEIAKLKRPRGKMQSD